MIYDISQEIFSCRIYPGDPKPERKTLSRIEEGDVCNLTAFSMCAHNGTHVDAPYHFIRDGRTVGQMGLEPFVGDSYLVRHEGDVCAKDAERILRAAEKAGADRRILIAGRAVVTAEAARVFAKEALLLLGNESQTVGPEDAPAEVHRILLGAGVALLEGIVLDGIPEGRYHLSAAPLNLGESDGAPCRAYLIDGSDSGSEEKNVRRSMAEKMQADGLSSEMILKYTGVDTGKAQNRYEPYDQTAKEVACEMLLRGLPVEMIHTATGVPYELLKELKSQIAE